MSTLRIHLICILAVWVSGAAYAQYNHAWTRFLDGPQNQTDGSGVTVVDETGMIYTAGTTGLETNSVGADFILAKYSPSGNLIWVQTYDGPGQAQDVLSDLEVKDGYVYLSGRISQPANWYGDSDLCAIKFRASDGARMWVHTFSGEFVPGLESSIDGAEALTIDDSGNVFVTGFTWEWSYYFPNADFCTIKLDPNGNRIWVRKYHGGASYVAISDKSYLTAVDPDGNLIVSGDAPGPNNSSESTTIKYRAFDGEPLWIVRASETNIVLRGYPASMRIGPNGDVYVLLKTFNNATAVVRYANDSGATVWWWNALIGHFGLEGAFQLASDGDPTLAVIFDPDFDDSNQNNNIRVIRLQESNGSVVFSTTYGNAVFGDYQAPRAVGALPNGSTAIVGHGSSAPYVRKPQIWQFGPTGDLEWTAYHHAEAITLESRQIVRDPFGSLVIGGHADGASPTRDLVVIKYASAEEFAPPIQVREVLGRITEGDVPDLYFMDANAYKVVANSQGRISLEADSQSLFAGAISLRLRIQAVTSRSGTGLTVRAMNFETGNWESIGTVSSAKVSRVSAFAVGTNARRFIHPVTHKITVRLDWSARSAGVGPPMNLDLGLLEWTASH